MSDCKLVPMEPTAEMVSEGARSLRIMSLPEREAASVFRAMLDAAPNMQGEPLRYTNDGALAECPCCGSLDVGGAHDTVHCYSCHLTVTKPRPLQNAIDAWNTRTGRTHPAPDVQGEPVAYISHTSEGDFLGWERQFDAPSHTPLYNTPQPAPSAPVGVGAAIEAFNEIDGLCRHLRQGGPAPEDLHDLSGALEEAIAIASNMLHALTHQSAEQQVIPNERGKNRYGLDMSYFRQLFNRELNRPLVDFKPSELARVLARASRTADSKVMHEAEFQQPAPDVSALVEALEEISDPIRFMGERLEEGERLNGMAAVQLAGDASYLRGIATAALTAHQGGES